MNTPNPGFTGPGEEGDKPNLRKPTDPASPTPGSASDDATRAFGRPFDYDATAGASLSEQPPTPDSLGGVSGTAGPGWDTYSAVGNGPGWGNTPSYPPPSDNPQGSYPPPGSYGYEQHGSASYQGQPVGEQPYGAPQDQGQPPYGQPQYGTTPTYGAPGPGYPGQMPPGYGQQPPTYVTAVPGFVDQSAPFGRDPMTGEPYSDKTKTTAGLLGIFLGGFGAGRFYLDQPGVAIAQIAVTWLTCGIGAIWPFIDGILMLTGSVRDKYNRPLRP